ncbi:hypothetical protein McanCB21832_002322 [Microsporum canis]
MFEVPPNDVPYRHKCEPCRKSNELHEKRHRDIAALVEQIYDLDRGEGTRTIKFADRVNALSENNTALPSVWNKVKGSRGAITRSTNQNPSLKRTQSIKDRRAEKRAIKFEKSVAKSIRRQASRPAVPGVILASSIEFVGKAIHRTSLLESSWGPEDADAFFVAGIQRFQALEKQAREAAAKLEPNGANNELREKVGSPSRERGEYGGVNKAELPIIREILAEFNIRINERNSSKDRKALLTKLAEAIFADMETVSNEARETMRRSAAYWRFANKRTYNAMVRNSKIVNWETGEKLTEDPVEE